MTRKKKECDKVLLRWEWSPAISCCREWRISFHTRFLFRNYDILEFQDSEAWWCPFVLAYNAATTNFGVVRGPLAMACKHNRSVYSNTLCNTE